MTNHQHWCIPIVWDHMVDSPEVGRTGLWAFATTWCLYYVFALSFLTPSSRTIGLGKKLESRLVENRFFFPYPNQVCVLNPCSATEPFLSIPFSRLLGEPPTGTASTMPLTIKVCGCHFLRRLSYQVVGGRRDSPAILRSKAAGSEPVSPLRCKPSLVTSHLSTFSPVVRASH